MRRAPCDVNGGGAGITDFLALLAGGRALDRRASPEPSRTLPRRTEIYRLNEWASIHAAQLRNESVDIGIISKQRGHRSIATTARYLNHIAPQQVIEAMQQRSWQAPDSV